MLVHDIPSDGLMMVVATRGSGSLQPVQESLQ